MEIALDSTNAVKVGRWWFQRRSLTPLPLFLMMILLPPQFELRGLALALVVAGIFAAEVLRIWAVGYAGSATRTRGDTVPVLVHAGPFRRVRNPLYIANIAMYSLAGFLFGTWILALVTLVFSIIQYTFIVAFEEDTLKRTFGQAYLDYCEKVPRWFPSLAPQIGSSAHYFSLAKALKSEKSTFFSMILMAGIYTARQIYLQ